MVERFNVVSISLFRCACCHAYVVFCAICVACSDCMWPCKLCLQSCIFPGAGMFSCPCKCMVLAMTSHCGLLFPVMRVLCLEIIDLTLFMQL